TRLAQRLNEQRVPLPVRRKNQAASWHPTLLHRILTNPAYTGAVVLGRTRAGKFHCMDRVAPGGVRQRLGGRLGRRVERVSDGEGWLVADGAHEALVDWPDWEAVQRKLQDRQVKSGECTGRSRTGTYPLSGIARCGVCGGPMIGWCLVRRRADGV